MNKTIMGLTLLVCLLVTNCRPAKAEEAPLLSAKRFSLAGGLNYEWRTTPFKNDSEPLSGRHAEWSTGLYGAYNLTPHSSLVASTTLGLDSRQFRHSLGIRIRLLQGSK